MRRMKAGAPRRGTLILALFAVLALVVGGTTGAAGSGGPTADAAKKKCKKGKKSAVAAKKKCKKKKTTTAPVTTLPTPTPGPPGPRPPISLSWTGDADLDLYVWDAAGNEAGPFDNDIPNSSNSGDVPDGGPETFTDNLVPLRELSVGVCMYEDETGGRTDFQFDYVDEAGVVVHANGFFEDPDPGDHVTFDGGLFGPHDPDVPTPGAWCDTSPK